MCTSNVTVPLPRSCNSKATTIALHVCEWRDHREGVREAACQAISSLLCNYTDCVTTVDIEKVEAVSYFSLPCATDTPPAPLHM